MQYAVPLISDRSYLRGGSGICALEAYHAGAIRMQLLQNSSAIIQPWGVDALTITQVRSGWLPMSNVMNIASELSPQKTLAVFQAETARSTDY